MQHLPRLLASTLALWAAACGSPDDNPGQVDAAADSGSGQWTQVRSHYGLMRAVAGAGATDTETNEWLSSFEGGTATSAELSRPHMAMADGAGNIYIADKEAHAIRKVTPGGTITTVAGTGVAGVADDTAGPATQRALANPNGLFVRADGTFYVLDLDHGRIRRVGTDGMMTTLVTAAGGISIGRGLWVDGTDGNERVFFSSGSAVKRWTPSGGVTTFATGFLSLGNLAMDSAGALLVTDRGASKVYSVDSATGMTKIVVAGNGTSLAAVDGSPALMTALSGVRAVWPAHPDDGGGFFVGTHEGCQLWFVDTAGVAHLFLDGEKDAHAGVGETFDTPGKKVSELRSVTLDTAGNVVIVDDDRGFVRIVARQ